MFESAARNVCLVRSLVFLAGLVNQCCTEVAPPAAGNGNSTSSSEPEIDRDFAFQAVRLAQGVGATTAFVLGATVCDVSVQLYVLVALLSTAVLGYIVVEYRLRKRAASATVSASGGAAAVYGGGGGIGSGPPPVVASTGPESGKCEHQPVISRRTQ